MRWYDRLRRPREIAYVRRRGRRFALTTIAAFAGEGAGRRSSVAISVSAALGGAVVRNRIRRRIRGTLDLLAPLEPPLRLLFVARQPAATEPYARLAADVRGAVESLSAQAR